MSLISAIKSPFRRFSKWVRGNSKKSFIIRLLSVIFIFLFLFVALSVGMMEFTAQNFFCGSCHEMREHYRTWKVSSHKDTNCVECHISPGIYNMVKTKVKALNEVYVHFTENKDFTQIREGIKAHVPDENCKICHKTTQNLVVYHSLKITHKDHWDRGTNCIVCHSRVVHGPRAEYKNTPSMETCRTCHDGKKAPDECSVCHVTLGLRAPSTFDPQWVVAHKMDVQQNEGTCQKCHPQDFCDSCHTSAKPHKSDWFPIHNVEAQKDKEKCLVCHKERYCSDCHELRRKHSLDWINTHKDEAKKNPQDCKECHKESFCSDCHTKFVRHLDGWLNTHGANVKKDGKQSCETCHEENFCSVCHNKYKHPDNWAEIHGKKVQEEKPKNCNVCHEKNFCSACHAKFKHPKDWAENHNVKATSDPKLCETCHKKDFCNTCHG
jgi:nitrate/TMAO reductase-like tetraheme cytochrome c subunit